MMNTALITNDMPGWAVPEDLTIDQWRDFGSRIKQAEGTLNWFYGDWLLAADSRWGEMYQEAMEITGRDYDFLAQRKFVSRTFQFLDRSKNLSWSHHWEAAKRSNGKALEYLAIAERDNLSKRQLIALIEADKRPLCEQETETTQPELEEDDRPLFADDLELDAALDDESKSVCPKCGQVYDGDNCPDCEPEGNHNYKRDNRRSQPSDIYTPQGMDACQTPPYAIDPLLPYLPEGWNIWEPACGEGYLEGALYDSGFSVITGDILTGQNFFDYQPDNWDCIVTNPPYSIQFQWLKRCYQLGKPFALLLKVEVLGTKGAQELMQQYGFEILLLDKRVDFKMPRLGWGDEEHKSNAQFPTFWLCWQLLPEKIRFGKLQKEMLIKVTVDNAEID